MPKTLPIPAIGDHAFIHDEWRRYQSFLTAYTQTRISTIDPWMVDNELIELFHREDGELIRKLCEFLKPRINDCNINCADDALRYAQQHQADIANGIHIPFSVDELAVALFCSATIDRKANWNGLVRYFNALDDAQQAGFLVLFAKGFSVDFERRMAVKGKRIEVPSSVALPRETTIFQGDRFVRNYDRRWMREDLFENQFEIQVVEQVPDYDPETNTEYASSHAVTSLVATAGTLEEAITKAILYIQKRDGEIYADPENDYEPFPASTIDEIFISFDECTIGHGAVRSSSANIQQKNHYGQRLFKQSLRIDWSRPAPESALESMKEKLEILRANKEQFPTFVRNRDIKELQRMVSITNNQRLLGDRSFVRSLYAVEEKLGMHASKGRHLEEDLGL